MRTSVKVSAGVGIGAAVGLALPLVASFEGLFTKAYRDPVGIVTVCYGETEGVRMGDRYSPQECADMLAKKLPRYANEIARCIKVPISDRTRGAFISFAYNVGSGAFCRSSLLKKLNAGKTREACDGLMVWNRAGGRVFAGLTRRRAAERAMCLEGI